MKLVILGGGSGIGGNGLGGRDGRDGAMRGDGVSAESREGVGVSESECVNE